MHVSLLHARVFAACTCLRCMHVSLLHARVFAVCTCLCCMHVSSECLSVSQNFKQMKQTIAKISYVCWKGSSVSVRNVNSHCPSSFHKPSSSLCPQLLWLKICELFHKVYLCVSSILTANSEYLRDINNRAVFVMGTENQMFNKCSVSRASKRRHFLSAVDTDLLLGLQVDWSDVTRQLRVMLVVHSIVHDRHAAIGDILVCQGVVCRSHCRQSGLLMWHREYLRGAHSDGQTSSLCRPNSTTCSILNVSWSRDLFLIQRRTKEAPHTFLQPLLLRQLSERCRYFSVQE